MPAKKITALTELTAVVDTDILAVVDDPGGTAVTKKITKANLVGGGNLFYLTCVSELSAQKILLWGPIGATNTGNDYFCTEASAQETIDFALTIRRLRIRLPSNALNATTEYAFRDDGVDVDSVTIAASTSGEVDGGDISVAVASGSKINFERDTSAASTGNSQVFISVQVERA